MIAHAYTLLLQGRQGFVMKVEKITAWTPAFLHAGYENNTSTNDTRDVIDDNSIISEKMDETMKYLNALSDEKKCDIRVEMDYDPQTKRGELRGVIVDREGKKPRKFVRVPINSDNTTSVENHINMFKNECRAKM